MGYGSSTADGRMGPTYVTQCPIQTGQSYTYNFFTITGRRGTLFWHASHFVVESDSSWTDNHPSETKRHLSIQETVQGSPIIFGEWWNADPEAVINQSPQTGAGPNVSDAYTINGLPGPLYNCSSKDTFRLRVKPGKKYLLRLINAAMNDELFISIANHTLTIVKLMQCIMSSRLLPGQTTNVFLKTKPHYPNATFLMAVRLYFTGRGTFDNSTVAGFLEYEHHLGNSFNKTKKLFEPTLFNISVDKMNLTQWRL